MYIFGTDIKTKIYFLLAGPWNVNRCGNSNNFMCESHFTGNFYNCIAKTFTRLKNFLFKKQQPKISLKFKVFLL